MRALSLLFFATTAAGCAATVDGSAGDGGADATARDVITAPVDVPTGPCRWRALPAVDVTPRSLPRHRLVDAIATEDGAWVAYRAHLPARDSDELRVIRVREDGTEHPDYPAGTTARADLFALPFRAGLEFSMHWDPTRRTLATLSEGMTDRGACVWTATEGVNARTIRVIDPSAVMPGFSRGGCRALLRTPGGYSFVSEEIRALWGTDLLAMSLAGDLTAAAPLPMTEAPAQQGVSRTALAGGGFVGNWVETTLGAPPRVIGLHARRFTDAGEPTGPMQVIATGSTTLKNAVVVETPGGMLALWEGPADTFPASDALLTRALDARAAPVREAEALSALGFFLGGLSATARGGEVLATAVNGGNGIRLTFAALDARGSLRAQVDTGLADVDGPSRTARVVATRAGALVFATVAQGADGGVVVAVPMRCE